VERGLFRGKKQGHSVVHFKSMNDFSPEKYPVVSFEESPWNWFVNACQEYEIYPDQAKKEALQRIYSHLLGVNEWMNLTRQVTQEDFSKYHVLDSLTILNLVEEYTEPGDVVLDLGSGGGYPGLPLALWLPDRRWRLVDSRAKKVSFLKEAIKLTGCRLGEARAFRGREAATAATDLYHKCKLITARAVGKTVDLLPDASALLERNGVFILMKGSAYPSEEKEHLTQTLPRTEFMLMDEQMIRLEENDPERWVVSLAKTE